MSVRAQALYNRLSPIEKRRSENAYLESLDFSDVFNEEKEGEEDEEIGCILDGYDLETFFDGLSDDENQETNITEKTCLPNNTLNAKCQKLDNDQEPQSGKRKREPENDGGPIKRTISISIINE